MLVSGIESENSGRRARDTALRGEDMLRVVVPSPFDQRNAQTRCIERSPFGVVSVAMNAADTRPPSPPGRTLRDTLDLLVALAALMTSVVSIWLALSQGDDMQRLVQAQSWPYVGFSSGNSTLDPATKQRARSLSLSVENLGVGPARVRSMSLFIDGMPVTSSVQLMQRAAGIGAEGALARQKVYTTQVDGRVLRAGEKLTYLRWDYVDDAEPAWSALDAARFDRIVVELCFCSVFEECWINRSNQRDATPVAGCPLIETRYLE